MCTEEEKKKLSSSSSNLLWEPNNKLQQQKGQTQWGKSLHMGEATSISKVSESVGVKK